MGWGHDDAISGPEREIKRLHHDMISGNFIGEQELTKEQAVRHYHELGKATQDKDVEPMNAMIKLLNMFDGVRVYRLK